MRIKEIDKDREV